MLDMTVDSQSASSHKITGAKRLGNLTNSCSVIHEGLHPLFNIQCCSDKG